MNSFISFFKKSPAFSIALLLALSFELFLEFYPNIDWIDPTGIYFTTYKRKKIESGGLKYPVLLVGDSRSLSLKGNTEIYNLSLPAAGPAYIPFLLEKYNAHNEKPKVLIYALDPEQFANPPGLEFHKNKKVWETFKHRIIYLFSPIENLGQYSGKDKYFIFKESLPILLPSFKHRDGLDSIFTDSKWKDWKEGNFGYSAKNKKLFQLVENTEGQVNLGSYLKIPAFVTSEFIEKAFQEKLKELNGKQEVYLESMEGAYEFCKKNQIQMIILDVPRAKGLWNTAFFREYRKKLPIFLDSHPEVQYLQFLNPEYPLELFAEAIHFNQKGEERVNSEFYEQIWPTIRKQF